ncbi:hypothetical protein R0I52_02050 [Psychrobacter sp. CAM01]|uniref:hypothetical protein n=1 Tax=Psychrobacter sp. CAM01 TaxID=3080335 RepID=UPI00293580A5|nr:hypothetical protein [Psychrobacter sp. CAM01]MDV2859492.1 hypothetical protein [Psychrobacter sp. CAM01]
MMKTSSTSTKIFPALLTVVLGSTFVLSGCQSVKNVLGKRDDGSLEYQQSKKLAPIELPVNKEPAPFVPLYPTPNAGTNTLTLKNDSGSQYQLPKPQRTVSTPSN